MSFLLLFYIIHHTYFLVFTLPFLLSLFYTYIFSPVYNNTPSSSVLVVLALPNSPRLYILMYIYALPIFATLYILLYNIFFYFSSLYLYTLILISVCLLYIFLFLLNLFYIIFRSAFKRFTIPLITFSVTHSTVPAMSYLFSLFSSLYFIYVPLIHLLLYNLIYLLIHISPVLLTSPLLHQINLFYS